MCRFEFSVGRCAGPEGVYAAARLESRRWRSFDGSLAALIDCAMCEGVQKAPQLCSPSAPRAHCQPMRAASTL